MENVKIGTKFIVHKPTRRLILRRTGRSRFRPNKTEGTFLALMEGAEKWILLAEAYSQEKFDSIVVAGSDTCGLCDIYANGDEEHITCEECPLRKSGAVTHECRKGLWRNYSGSWMSSAEDSCLRLADALLTILEKDYRDRRGVVGLRKKYFEALGRYTDKNRKAGKWV